MSRSAPTIDCRLPQLRKLRAVGQTGFGEHVADVALDRAYREMQLRGDRLVGEPVGHEPDHLQWAREHNQ
jgi:hypothetical protein